MYFVEQYFNKHHFFRAPHKWFFALLSSPIHFAELHYKKRYHLQFAHARKLFIFDIILLLSAVGIAIMGIFWYTYDPTVTKLVYVHIQSSSPRILSGEYVTYTITYKNDSPITLTEAKLNLNLPTGFVFNQAEPLDIFANNQFSLPNIQPQEAGQVSISGWIYGTPNEENYIQAVLNYRQESKTRQEEKSTLFIKSLRGSLLETSIIAPEKVLQQSIVPIKIILANHSAEDLTNILLPLNFVDYFLTTASVDLGIMENNHWKLNLLPSEKTAELQGQLKISPRIAGQEKPLSLTPLITIDKEPIPQTTIAHDFQIAYPEMTIQSAWQNKETVKPGETATLVVTVKNTGNIDLDNSTIQISGPNSILDLNRLARINLGSLQNQTLFITATELPSLKQIQRGETITHNIQIPIKDYPTGSNDLVFNATIKTTGAVSGVAGTYENISNSTNLKVGTKLTFQPEIRYYTNEGDQLGRGPLPPRVGEETKYWAFIQINNSTSQANDLKFSATLPANVTWTGKSSVSYGLNLTYNPANKTLNWEAKSLPANTNIGLYFELALVPNAEQLNTEPELLKNISLTALDNYIGVNLSAQKNSLNTALPTDSLGQVKGTKVVE